MLGPIDCLSDLRSAREVPRLSPGGLCVWLQETLGWLWGDVGCAFLVYRLSAGRLSSQRIV